MVNHNIVCQSLICMQFSYIYLDVLKAGIWKDMQKVEAPHLQELAKDLPNLVMSSKAASTTAKYVRAFNRWKRWASQFPEVQAFLAWYLAQRKSAWYTLMRFRLIKSGVLTFMTFTIFRGVFADKIYVPTWLS